MKEFDIIQKYFNKPISTKHQPFINLGIGDDCAYLQTYESQELAITQDMFIENVHFFSNTSPHAIGYKALAVNLSDLAAAGAKPLAFLLSLSLPEVNDLWLEQFSQGLFALANQFECNLIGGDTSRGPLSITITAFGLNKNKNALLRKNACLGDDIYVSGHLGNARLALEALLGKITVSVECLEKCKRHLEYPIPRVALGQALSPFAHASIDLSDGLLGDLQHILNASKVGAQVYYDSLFTPLTLSAEVLQLSPQEQRLCVLSGGDDYELLFTAPRKHQATIAKISQDLQIPLTAIGTIIDEPNSLILYDLQGHQVSYQDVSYQHFS
ncbi:MAG: thiamine-phosphate kinase [Gammaproteobacteria bacterium]|nr:thiamine-phosphate kinase [Gammaproteobacteria bacterium]